MKSTFNIYFIKGIAVCVIALMTVGCKPKFKAKDPQKGLVNAERVVYIGSGSFAGYTDAALTAEGQNFSVATLLSKQLKGIGAPDIVNPMVSESSVGIDITGTKSVSVLAIKTACDGSSGLSPIKKATSGDLGIFNSIYNSSTKYTNVSVPFMSAAAANFSGLAAANPFFGRFTSIATSTVIQEAMATNPTFFAMMMGEQDVLGYALSGGTIALTPQAQFDASIQSSVNTLTSNGAKGVITNIPNVLEYPIFNTIAWNALVLDEAKAASLTNAWISFINRGDNISFVAGANGFLIEDGYFNGNENFPKYRNMVAGELVNFSVTGDAIKCSPQYGSLAVMPDQFVLTLSEIDQIKNATVNFNSSLNAIAASKDLAIADLNSTLAKLKSGYPQNGIVMNTKFVSGGAFSLDGLHMTPRGNALIANTIINAINAKYGASINTLDVSKYRAVIFP